MDCMHTVIQIRPMTPALQLEDNGVPVYVQIRDQMLRAIGAGTLQPGEQMPTMRELAVALKVDLNTVRHAYAELEKTGAIVIVRARGTYVADKPPPVNEDLYAKRVEDVARQAIAMANGAGVAPEDVAEQIFQHSKRIRSSK